MAGLWFEEFELGRRFAHEIRRTVTEMDNVLFSSLTYNPAAIHIDHAYAATTEFGRPLVNSLFTLGLYLRTTNDKVNLQVMRGTKQLAITVPVVEPRHDASRLAELSDPAKNLIPRLGIVGATVTPEVTEVVGGTRRPSGVLVTATVANRLAVDSGLQEGDIIHSLNRTPIKSMDDLRAAFSQLKPGDPAAMQVERNGHLTFLTFEME